jgi:hypothetical protein
VCRSRSTISIGRDGGLGQEGRRGAGDEHAEVLPFRNVFVDGLVERDAAFLDQHHEGDR